MRCLIGNTLRIGVRAACLVAFIGGVRDLFQHGSDPLPDEYDFSSRNAPAESTTWDGIFAGLFHFTAIGWIQTGVLILLLTPVLRVLLSLFDFLRERDWLYAIITAVVLAVIISNSLEGAVSI